MKHHRVKPGHRVDLDDRDAGDTDDYKSEPEAAGRADELRQKLDALQERLYAEGRRAVAAVVSSDHADPFVHVLFEAHSEEMPPASSPVKVAELSLSVAFRWSVDQ